MYVLCWRVLGVTNYFGMDDLNWNHISARSNDGGILITPGDQLWDMIEPEDIVKDSENLTANIIHDAVYAANPEINAVCHLHTASAVAVSCLEEGFLFLDQNVSAQPATLLRPPTQPGLSIAACADFDLRWFRAFSLLTSLRRSLTMTMMESLTI